MTIRNNNNYIRVLLYSYYTTVTGWGVLLTSMVWGLRLKQRKKSNEFPWEIFPIVPTTRGALKVSCGLDASCLPSGFTCTICQLARRHPSKHDRGLWGLDTPTFPNTVGKTRPVLHTCRLPAPIIKGLYFSVPS